MVSQLFFFIHLARRKGHSYTAKHNYYINCSVCDIFDKIMEKITYLPVEVTWILYEGNIVTSIHINFGHKNGLQTAINFVQFLWQPRSEPSIINQLSTHSVLWMNKLKKNWMTWNAGTPIDSICLHNLMAGDFSELDYNKAVCFDLGRTTLKKVKK